MKNYIQKGQELDYVIPTGKSLTVGQAILLGSVLFVVFSTNNNTATAAAGETVSLVSYGVFGLPKAAGSGTGFAIGGPVYWDNAAQAVTGINGQAAVAATTTIAITTPSALNDTLAGLSVGGVQLLAGPLTLVADGTTTTEAQIAAAINANSSVSGFTATAGSDVVTVSGGTAQGATINGEVIVTGAVTGTMVLNTANGNSAAFASGVDGTTNFLIGYGWDQVAAADGDTAAVVKLKVG